MLNRSTGRWSGLVLIVVAAATLAPTASAAATPADVVLYAADATNLRGDWALRADGTAAGGQSITGTDNGWSATSNALASPAHSFDLTLTAVAGTPYHVWFRLKAGADSKYNDSVYAQFSDAVDGGGTPLFRIGTTTALVVNLQRCNGCALSGWGWMEGAYWLSQSSTVAFAASGAHTLRVQTREDGVAIDQVVLSPLTYLNAAPGAAVSDGTIVAKPAPASTPASASSPYAGSPAAIPGTIQAVGYDLGGEGVGYHDTTPGNSGGAFRVDGVDIEAASAGGYDVGWVAPGEWLNYSVNVAAAGQYDIGVMVAASGQGGTFHLDMNGTNVTGPLTVPNTGGWQTWQTVTATATLAAGRQIMRLVADTTGAAAVGNFLSIRFTAATQTVSDTPFSGTPAAIPGTIAAADFDNGGAGVAYLDATPGNTGGAYRSTDVDIEASSDGGYDVGWIAAGERLNYSVNAAAAGSYNLQLRLASPGGGAMHISFGAPSSTSAPVTVPATGGWQAWVTVSVPVALAAGRQTMTLTFDTGGFNVGTITVVPGSRATPAVPPASAPGSTITVPAGGDLQRAIDAAVAGDTILLQAGATFAGSYVLPVKSGASFVTIRSSAPDASLPADGVRISPASAGQLARVQGGIAGMPAFVTAPGAHHFRLQFLEIVNTYANNDIIQLGDGSAAQSTLSNIAHDLVVDRCYIHGDVSGGQKRGIALNSASTSVVNSYISDIKSAESEAQALSGWNGPGPYTITNNFIEASGENVMFGGSDPYIANLVPSDIVIRQNTISKPPSWRPLNYTIKNLVELKNAQRVTIDGNVIENCWAAGQQGFAIMLTPRNQNGTAPWSVVQQVTITNNIIRHVASGIDVLGADDINPSQTTNGILISNNLLLDVGGVWGGQGRTLLTLGGRNITFAHNTVFSDGPSVVYADLAPVSGFVFSNNIVPDNAWALMGSGAAAGNGTIAAYYPGAVVSRNVFIGGTAGTYPADNYFPGTVATVQFRNISAGDYGLAAGSPYVTSATDGTAVGVNQAVIDALIPR